MENKRRFSVMQIITFVLGGLFLLALAVDFVLRILLMCGINLFFKTFTSHEICYNLEAGLICFFPVMVGCVLAAVTRFKVVKKIILSVGVALLCGGVAFVIFCGYVFTSAAHVYYEYTTPDGEHELVFQENQYFMKTDVSIYEKTSENVLRKLGTTPTDEFYPQNLIQNPDVARWNENGFSIKIYSYGKFEYLDFKYYK